MGKNKLKRFAELETMQRVFQPGARFRETEHELKGQWHERVFGNNNPIVLEMGCGRGEYTVKMAQTFPEKNFVGIDKKGARLWRGAKTSNEENLHNAAFLRTQAEHLSSFFAPSEVSEIWITFPEPHLQQSRQNNRMTSPVYLDRYRSVMVPNGLVHLKTDNLPLFEYTVQKLGERQIKILDATSDLYARPGNDELLEIKTTYESRFLQQGMKICYLRFSLD